MNNANITNKENENENDIEVEEVEEQEENKIIWPNAKLLKDKK